MIGLTLPGVSDNRPAYIEVRMLNSVAVADMNPKSKIEPFRYPTKYNGIRTGNIPKAIPWKMKAKIQVLSAVTPCA
jgi:hypothetical protein